MVDQNYIEEIKRRNAERAAKLKDSLKFGDFTKLEPGAGGKVERESGAAPPGPPPPPTTGGAAPPPPPPGAERSSAPPPPPGGRAAEPRAPEPPAAPLEEATDSGDTASGLWDEILGPATRPEEAGTAGEAAAVPEGPEERPRDVVDRDVVDDEEFVVPAFDTPGGEGVAGEAVEEPVETEEAEDEYLIPAFDSSPGETPPVSGVPTEEPAALAEEGLDDFVVPDFDSAATPVAAAEEPAETVETEEPVEVEAAEPATEDEFVVPAFDTGAPPTETEETELVEEAVPAFDSTPAASDEIIEPETVPTFDSAPAAAVVPEAPVDEVPVFGTQTGHEPPPREAPAQPVAEAEAAAEHSVILEVVGTELRLRRRNITLRESIYLLETAAEECRKLLEE